MAIAHTNWQQRNGCVKCGKAQGKLATSQQQYLLLISNYSQTATNGQLKCGNSANGQHKKATPECSLKFVKHIVNENTYNQIQNVDRQNRRRTTTALAF